MVQVDVFWTYGLSAGLALAAGKKLRMEKSLWQNQYFTLSLLWTSLIFAPSGLYLLWNFPGWETMFVAKNHLSIPAWLVCLFAMTNVALGILGFVVTATLLRQGQTALAKAQTMWSHAAMLFILIFGWDGTGFRRFLYAGTGEEWHNAITYPLVAFFQAEIFWTLLAMGLVFLPTYIGLLIFFRRSAGATGNC